MPKSRAKTGKKILSLLSKIDEKKAAEEAKKVAAASRSAKEHIVKQETVANAVLDQLDANPYFLDELAVENPSLYEDVVSMLPPQMQRKEGRMIDEAITERDLTFGAEPEDVAKNLEAYFEDYDQITEYIQNLNGGENRRFMENLSPQDYELFQGFEMAQPELGPRELKNKGGSMLVPPEREGYSKGSSILKKLITPLSKNQKATRRATRSQAAYAKDMAGAIVVSGGIGYALDSDKGQNLVKQAEAGEIEVDIIKADERINPADYPTYQKNTDSAKAFRDAFSSARAAGADSFEFEGRTYSTEIQNKAKGGKAYHIMPDGTKMSGAKHGYAEGSMLVPPEMETPVDTYENVSPEEADAAQLPDEEMMQQYVDYVVDESLNDEEKTYLMDALQADPMLSQIFDKVVETASEYTGAGLVEGPGSGISDSIPARLSAGEFVFTKKATDQLGADNLQKIMDDAERAYDGGLMSGNQNRMQITTEPTQDTRQQMLLANRMPSIR